METLDDIKLPPYDPGHAKPSFYYETHGKDPLWIEVLNSLWINGTFMLNLYF